MKGASQPPPSHPLLVSNVSLGPPDRDVDTTVEWLDRTYRISRRGTDGDVSAAERLAAEQAAHAAAVAVTGVRDARTAGRYDGDLAAVARILQAAAPTPATNGHELRDVLQEWTVRHAQQVIPGLFTNARVVVFGGRNHRRTARVLSEFTPNLTYADPLLRYGVNEVWDTLPTDFGADQLAGAAAAALSPLTGIGHRLNHRLLLGTVRDADVLVATYDELAAFGLEELAGKTLISSSISEDRLANLQSRGVAIVLDDVPQPFADITVNEATLQAMMMAAVAGDELTDDDLLDMITSAGLVPRVLRPDGSGRRSRFAFVIHPLSQQYFRQVEPLGTVAKFAPGIVMDTVEKALAYAPPFVYSHVTGITSPTGDQAEGWLITVGGTPKELLAHSPEFTYRRLLAAANIARKLGAQIMGLGAFTKVVGDAGVTVAKRAPLPITTGNSYSASGALWAAHDAVSRLGLVPVDKQGRMRGSAMVVGATGAIGSACARLLALACDDLYLVSPETGKLLALQAEMAAEKPRARLHVAATPHDALPDMDVIVTATSGAGKRVLDIEQVKPGAVITDVARPLDLSAEDVAKRPDVLVVESGEIRLPGEPHMRDIGLPAGVVYACLAETIVLALEGRFENFTVGRNIEWPKVKEIYRLGLKHGMQLASISGVNGVFSDADIDRIRELALARRKKLLAS